MTRRLATMCFVIVLTAGVPAPGVHAQDEDHANATLKGIKAVLVLVEDLPDGAKMLGLTTESIQTDVELKLRLAGMRVVTRNEWLPIAGNPYLYVRVNVTKGAQAGSVEVDLNQDVLLKRNGAEASGVPTWTVGQTLANPDAQFVREQTKDLVDRFLNAWLSVNPTK
jgi:hypothetical protein